MKYYLLDLERSVLMGVTTYWKPAKRGYTTDIKAAGLYSEEIADEIVQGDFDKRTVKIESGIVERLQNA